MENKINFKIHEESGIPYRVFETENGLVRLFNTNRPERLEFETFLEYKIRRSINNQVTKLKKEGTRNNQLSKWKQPKRKK